jgi:serine/threonine-protein kinase
MPVGGTLDSRPLRWCVRQSIMSDPRDKSRPDRERGPLPRSNLPRRDAGRRGRRAVDDEKAEAEAAPVSQAIPASVVEEMPPTPRVSPVVDPGAEAPVSTAAEPAVAPQLETLRGVPKLEPTRIESAEVIGERPTQLAPNGPNSTATGPSQTTRDSEKRLKRVGLSRADGSAAEGSDEAAGPGSTYVGYIIDERYRIEGVLGRGGMGVVYRARHEVIDKLVAIKILLPTEDGDVVERFVNEARAATAIGNAHIVDTVDFGALPDGSTYFVMEYIEGRTLAKIIKAEGFIAPARAIGIAKQIAEGMSAVHRAGIVHRDLKPENIFLTPREGEDDFVKLVDFGIAKMQHAQHRITRAGTIFGTPHYMSPEQAAGAEVDERADVYAIGVILYEMLAGRVPFDAENPLGLLTQHLYTDPLPLTRLEGAPQAIPPGLDAVVLKCLAKKPDDRYGSAEELLLDLERVEEGTPPLALADLVARAERTDDRELLVAAKQGLKGTSESRWKSWLAALVAFFLVGAVAALLSFGHDTTTAPARQEAVNAAAQTALVAPAKAKSSPPKKQVALVFSPIDGEVFRDDKSLGGMPVTVALAPGEVANVVVRREGFYPEKVKLDGSRPVVIVQLRQIPGVRPSVPVPSAGPMDALRHSNTSESIAAWLNERAAQPPSRAGADAGAGATSGGRRAPSSGATAASAGAGPSGAVPVDPSATPQSAAPGAATAVESATPPAAAGTPP